MYLLRILYYFLVHIIFNFSSLSLPNSFSLSKVTEPVDHAEGPFWDPRSEILYFVDIHNGKVYSYNYNNNAVNYLSLGGDVAIVVPSKQNPNLLIVARNRSVLAVEWNGNSNKETAEQILTTVAENFPTSRFNDGKADKEGRLWFGKNFVTLLPLFLKKRIEGYHQCLF